MDSVDHKFLWFNLFGRMVFYGTIFGVLLLLAAACQPSTQKAKVSFAFAGDGAELAAYQTLITAFEQAHPHVKIELRHAPSRQDFQQKLITMFDAGESPAVVLLNYRRVARFAADGDLRPVGPHVAALRLEREAFYPIALEAFTWKDELWCVPQNISSLVVYYNQTLFDTAGLPYPTADWTWDEFVQTAAALTAGETHGAGIEPTLYRLAPLVWRADGVLFTEAQGLLPPIPENVAALEQLAALQTSFAVVPNRVAAEAQSLEDRFVAGKIGMFFDSRRLTPTLRAAADFRWDVAPLPLGEQAAGVLHSDGYCLGSSPTAEALTFIRFATSVQGQTILAQTGRTVPSRIAVAESATFLNPEQLPMRSQVWLDGVSRLKHVPLHPDWIRWEERASAEIKEAFYGRLSAKEALVAIRR